MAWLQLRVEVADAAADAVALELESLGAVAVTFAAAGADEVFEPDPGERPLWAAVRLDALFEVDADIAAVRARLEATGARLHDIDIVEDTEWQEAWRPHAVRDCFGGRLWVVPRDEALPAEAAGGVALRLDPGLAFGSGAHPTTRLCLEWLAGADLAGKRVLDFGCGSGILALAAALLGAREVVAIDHDPQALTATRENAAYNAVGAERLRVGDLEPLQAQGWGDEPFDVVIANILANPLVTLAPLLTRLTAAGGALVLSGLLADQEAAIRAAYPGIRFAAPVQREDWIRLDGTVR